MSPRNLKIALAVSVALNVFAIAGASTAWVMSRQINASDGPDRPHSGGPAGERGDRSFRDIVARLDPAVQARVRTTMRASALAARPDFEAAHAARAEAIDLMKGASPDAGKADALLATSRAAEMRGRNRLEHDAVTLLATLGPADRTSLSGILDRRGGGGRGGRGGGADRGSRPDGPPPVDASRPASAN